MTEQVIGISGDKDRVMSMVLVMFRLLEESSLEWEGLTISVEHDHKATEWTHSTTSITINKVELSIPTTMKQRHGT